jgi:hypothetical protein
VSPVRYELGPYIPEDAILHSHRHENLKRSLSVCISVHVTTGHGLNDQGVGIKISKHRPAIPAQVPPSLLSSGYWDVLPKLGYEAGADIKRM